MNLAHLKASSWIHHIGSCGNMQCKFVRPPFLFWKDSFKHIFCLYKPRGHRAQRTFFPIECHAQHWQSFGTPRYPNLRQTLDSYCLSKRHRHCPPIAKAVVPAGSGIPVWDTGGQPPYRYPYRYPASIFGCTLDYGLRLPNQWLDMLTYSSDQPEHWLYTVTVLHSPSHCLANGRQYLRRRPAADHCRRGSNMPAHRLLPGATVTRTCLQLQ